MRRSARAAGARAFRAAERWLLQRPAASSAAPGSATMSAPWRRGQLREWRFPAEIEPATGRGRRGLASASCGSARPRRGHRLQSATSPPTRASTCCWRRLGEVLREQPTPCCSASVPRPTRDRRRRRGCPPTSAAVSGCSAASRAQRVPLFMGLADILVSPRSYGDNFPLKLFDYLAAWASLWSPPTSRPTAACSTTASPASCRRPPRVWPAASSACSEQPDEAGALAPTPPRASPPRELSWGSFKHAGRGHLCHWLAR